jgi:hypothetical protein
MAWKGCDWKRTWPVLKYLTETTEENLCQDSSYGGDSNWWPSESKQEMLSREPAWSIYVMLLNLNSGLQVRCKCKFDVTCLARLLELLRRAAKKNIHGETTAAVCWNVISWLLVPLLVGNLFRLSHGWLANQFLLTYLRQCRKCNGSLYSACVWMSCS